MRMTVHGYFEKRYLTKTYRDRMDVGEAFSKAVKELEPHRESPVRHLFALDGLGNPPRTYRLIGNSD